MLSVPIRAQELNAFGGFVRDKSAHDTSYSYQVEYMRALGDRTAISLGYLNEGHLPSDHRDGYPLQFWGRTRMHEGRFTLSGGVGPYLYLDTNSPTGGTPFSDRHGVAGIASLDAAWSAGDRWSWHLRGNYINGPGDFDTMTFSLGLGYVLAPEFCSPPSPRVPSCVERTTGQQVTLLGGIDIVNSFSPSKKSLGEQLEYRTGLGRHTDWTVSLLHEDDRLLARRLGLASQVWVTRAVAGTGEWTLGLGAGPYVRLTTNDNPSTGEPNPQRVCPMISATAARRLNPHWTARFTWNRMVTNDDRDTDTLLLGLGYDLAEPKH